MFQSCLGMSPLALNILDLKSFPKPGPEVVYLNMLVLVATRYYSFVSSSSIPAILHAFSSKQVFLLKGKSNKNELKLY